MVMDIVEFFTMVIFLTIAMSIITHLFVCHVELSDLLYLFVLAILIMLLIILV